MSDVPKQLVERRGNAVDIAYATNPSGSQPARKFLASLPKQSGHEDAAAATHELLATLAKTGRICQPNRHKPLRRDGLYELRPSHQVRIIMFLHKGAWFLTHGFIKRQKKIPAREIDKAIKIKKATTRYLDEQQRRHG